MDSESSLNETMGSCRPWTNQNVRDSINILNNLQLNLCSYEKVYKKHSIKTKDELPQIFMHKTMKNKTSERSIKRLERGKMKTLESSSKSKTMKYGASNKSVQISKQTSEPKLMKLQFPKRGRIPRCNKQNNEGKTSRECENVNIKSRCDIKSKVCFINFDEQNKYRMLRKRELHHLVFGQRPKTKRRQLAELR